MILGRGLDIHKYRMREFMKIVEARVEYPRFSGMGGLCGQAAVAINRTIFGGRGQLVGCFNDAFYYQADRMTGHVAVLMDGIYWDADATPKTRDDIESWGMLDVEDPDYKEFADEYSIEWNDETANAVVWVEMVESDVLAAFGNDKLESMMRHLGAAKIDKIVEAMEILPTRLSKGGRVYEVNGLSKLQTALSRSSYGSLRGMLYNNTLMVWDADHGTHNAYEQTFGDEGAQRMMFSNSGIEYNDQDFASEDEVRTNPVLMKIFGSDLATIRIMSNQC